MPTYGSDPIPFRYTELTEAGLPNGKGNTLITGGVVTVRTFKNGEFDANKKLREAGNTQYT